MKLNIKNTFTKQLPADPSSENTRRQVAKACFSYVEPKATKNPKLLHVSPELLETLGISAEESESEEFLKLFTGNAVLPDTKPYAMCYGGHQFGHWAGQLGDGRAINLFEIAQNQQQWALQLKGAGETPYSRTADGLAVLRSSIREYLCSEAMFHLGVPTTRALSLALTGDLVLRDVMYDGHPGYEKGAVVCRVAPSFIRFGNFELLTSRQDDATLKQLTDYTIAQFFPQLGKPSKATYISFFEEVAKRSLEMVIHWQRVGFVHGVMNTDNMSILGLTIDYGPYGWLEAYEKGWTPNTTDRQFKRYKYGAQPDMLLWNLNQLANALYPSIEDTEGLERILNDFRDQYFAGYLKMMRSKLGLSIQEHDDAYLITDLEQHLELTETDMSIFFRNLANFSSEKPSEGLEVVQDAFYSIDEVSDKIRQQWNAWFEAYAKRLKLERNTSEDRKEKMNQVNPKYVLRNYMAQLAIDDADKGNYETIDELFKLLKRPYDEQPEHQKWFAKRPEWARHKVGCSMLSCSS
ncbi:YdiU family protein [Subsaximicrobium wynnwilliamsii]|uniref:Protein nucleotidyltransferase YdiU n=1 Tax=Subsaximicrobium wynnwilliamsii TaxID=291179 RepID=A0A5C6ZP25_9FLAO|nr:YdiU family protein [Subsaximicrobium wynnwilliamsii]TXD84789.1 YdiU family protein [Subsaximicrobium wynnwilliamsii]TXD90460.1 YdiU family protein [Subsaximicrobium wynnwilliamsii]TXE04936.1 YdiU family protein [Subsaximicrobium wynnwilliamsii]